MRRFLLIAVTGILFFASIGGHVWAATESLGLSEATLGVIVDGKPVEFSEESGFPYVSDSGNTMLPVRVCLDAIDSEVVWNDATKTIITRKGNTEVTIPVGKNEIFVNGKKVEAATSAVIKTDRVFLPLRAVFEAYGYQVDWDSKTRLVTATSYMNPKLTPLLDMKAS